MEGFKGPDFAVDRGILRRRDFQGMSKNRGSRGNSNGGESGGRGEASSGGES